MTIVKGNVFDFFFSAATQHAITSARHFQPILTALFFYMLRSSWINITFCFVEILASFFPISFLAAYWKFDTQSHDLKRASAREKWNVVATKKVLYYSFSFSLVASTKRKSSEPRGLSEDRLPDENATQKIGRRHVSPATLVKCKKQTRYVPFATDCPLAIYSIKAAGRCTERGAMSARNKIQHSFDESNVPLWKRPGTSIDRNDDDWCCYEKKTATTGFSFCFLVFFPFFHRQKVEKKPRTKRNSGMQNKINSAAWLTAFAKPWLTNARKRAGAEWRSGGPDRRACVSVRARESEHVRTVQGPQVNW